MSLTYEAFRLNEPTLTGCSPVSELAGFSVGVAASFAYAVRRSWQLRLRIDRCQTLRKRYRCAGSKHVKPIDRPAGSSGDVKGIMEEFPNLHIPYAIPWGNMWASCYFAMTGFHAIHVLGGLVIFAVMLIMAMRGRFGVQHAHFVEYTGLYWHFVDIVWIFLFPLLYLV